MPAIQPVPSVRLRSLTSYDVNPAGQFVLYWMTAFRRPYSNFALQHACQLAEAMEKPLVVIEALRTGYRWACDRFHRFVIDGMLDNQRQFDKSDVLYFPFLETTANSGSGLVEELGAMSCCVVTDDFPCFFHPLLYKSIVANWKFGVHAVDSNGLLPMRAADRTFTVAHSFRRYLQKELPKYLESFPMEEPLSNLKLPKLEQLPKSILKRWPPANLKDYTAGTQNFDRFAINHSVCPCNVAGGFVAAGKRLEHFVTHILGKYHEQRNVPDADGASRLSPYLHFGHISAHQVFRAAMDSADWNTSKIKKPNGKSTGYWGANAPVEAFIDELVTWREIGFNMCSREPDYDKYHSLPNWAKQTLADHAKDKRHANYSFEQLDNAQTKDELWNAAQNELRREGRIHNYLRMLWGKNVLAWTPDPHTALKYLIELNNKYALDGRDPNSYSGIFWVLGRYDRAWGPERKVFGKVRYMTSDSTRRKFPMKQYLAKFGN